MKTRFLIIFLLFWFFLPLTGQSQKLIKGIELGAQTAVPHYFSWGQYGEEEIDLLRPYVQSNVTSYVGGFLEKRLNPVFSVRTGLLMHQISFNRLNSVGQVPNILNHLQIDNGFYRRSTQHRLGIPVSLRAVVSRRITIGGGVHISRTFLTTARGWNDQIFPGGNPQRIQVDPRFVFVPDYHLATFLTASYLLKDFSSKALFVTITGEYDHQWGMPTSNGINYRLVRLGLGVELRFE